jgi:hypothetical protein
MKHSAPAAGIRGEQTMTDAESFLAEVMDFLREEDILELTEKAGVRFPMEPDWKDLCYVCAWVGLKVHLPPSLHNRMMLGEQNEWTRIYSRSLSYIKSTRTEWIRPEDDCDMRSISNLAS